MNRYHLHLVSDSTGETINSVARAAIAQFDEAQATEHFWNMVRTDRQLSMVCDGIVENPGPVMFTLVNETLRWRLQDFCREMQVPCIPVLDSIISTLAAYLGQESRAQPGRQHNLDDEYFHRIEAMDFALAHDDGQSAHTIAEADVILVGVSRTSKTPTSIYLANRGIKPANIPFVPGVRLPPQLDNCTQSLIVGLTKEAESLVQVRRNRLHLLNEMSETDYVDPETVRNEVLEARRYFTRRHWPIIDVTRRSIEETAAEILALLARRQASLKPLL